MHLFNIKFVISVFFARETFYKNRPSASLSRARIGFRTIISYKHVGNAACIILYILGFLVFVVISATEIHNL